MLKRLLVTLLGSLPIFGVAQSRYEQFQKLLDERDTAKQRTLLKEWERTGANDPEFYTSAFNFYFHVSKHELITLQDPPTDQKIYENSASNWQAVFSVKPEITYDSTRLDSGFAYIDKGINKFPDRLDMRFGKTYAFGELKDFEAFTKEIVRTLDRARQNNNNWLWTNNEKLKDGEDFMLNAVFDYMKQLYETEDDGLLVNIQQIGDKVIAHYRNNIEIISLTAAAYMLTDNFDKAITYFKQAEKIDPKDFIVLNNIARTYRMMGDKVNALKYYELTAKYGDEEAKETAIANINELKRQQ